jgi:voltage-gated potassium channel
MATTGEAGYRGVLQRRDRSIWWSLLRRTALACAIILAVTALLWYTRDGLRDNANPDQPLTFIATLYFTVITLTTVGYGDIIPATDGARLINAVLLTPIRIFILFLFIGTAYELSVASHRFREGYRMQQLRARLSGHIVVCGYGVKGRTIVAELLAHGQPPENIVVIDPGEASIAEAAAQGLVALRGDASSEAILRAAVVDKASYVLVAPDRDDACVLICLTVNDLAPGVRVIAAAREDENVRLIYRAGADVVVSPSTSGGRLMAAAVRQGAVPRFLEDLLTFGQGIDAAERVVAPGEAGRTIADLPDLAGTLVLGLVRGEQRFLFNRCATLPLAAGDVIVYLTDHAKVKD